MPEKPSDQPPESAPLFPDDFAGRPGTSAAGEEQRRSRRPSPLGLMGPPQDEAPRASGWPSARAAVIMLAVMAAILAAVWLAFRK